MRHRTVKARWIAVVFAAAFTGPALADDIPRGAANQAVVEHLLAKYPGLTKTWNVPGDGAFHETESRLVCRGLAINTVPLTLLIGVSPGFNSRHCFYETADKSKFIDIMIWPNSTTDRTAFKMISREALLRSRTSAISLGTFDVSDIQGAWAEAFADVADGTPQIDVLIAAPVGRWYVKVDYSGPNVGDRTAIQSELVKLFADAIKDIRGTK